MQKWYVTWSTLFTNCYIICCTEITQSRIWPKWTDPLVLDACGGRLPGIIFCLKWCILGQKEMYVPATTGCAPAHVNHTLNRNRSCKPNGHLVVMLYKLQVLRVVVQARRGVRCSSRRKSSLHGNVGNPAGEIAQRCRIYRPFGHCGLWTERQKGPIKKC